MPDVIVIAGPNGAGKSTLAPKLLRDKFEIKDFVNADTIASGLSAFDPAGAAFDAGRIMLRRIHELAEAGANFAFETTLASRHYFHWLSTLANCGYGIHIIYLWLDSPELAIERVRERVRLGGHDVPEETIRRRYTRGFSNFFQLYKALADSWQFFDTSKEFPLLIAEGDKFDGDMAIMNEIWRKLNS